MATIKQATGKRRGPKPRYGQALIRTSFQCPQVMIDQCDAFAVKIHRSRADVMRQAIDEFLNRQVQRIAE